jgi:hypothetical protein
MVCELHSYAVTELCMEARTPALNQRDIATTRGARYGLPKGTSFRINHIAGSREALFWAADIVAGAVRAHREGTSDYHAILRPCIYEIDVATGC